MWHLLSNTTTTETQLPPSLASLRKNSTIQHGNSDYLVLMVCVVRGSCHGYLCYPQKLNISHRSPGALAPAVGPAGLTHLRDALKFSGYSGHHNVPFVIYCVSAKVRHKGASTWTRLQRTHRTLLVCEPQLLRCNTQWSCKSELRQCEQGVHLRVEGSLQVWWWSQWALEMVDTDHCWVIKMLTV